MSDEEVLKLTVPDQLCENLDMVIVSNDWQYSVLAHVKHDLISTFSLLVIAAGDSELFLANKLWTNLATGGMGFSSEPWDSVGFSRGHLAASDWLSDSRF